MFMKLKVNYTDLGEMKVFRGKKNYKDLGRLLQYNGDSGRYSHYLAN